MPRNRAVDYPTVHPPTAQVSYGLAPPQNHIDPNRFSWQGPANEPHSPSHTAERQLEGEDDDQGQELVHPKVPPLPVLPTELVGPGQQDSQVHPQYPQSHQPYPTQQNIQSAQQSHSQSLQYQYQQLQQQQLQQQAGNFSPEYPRQFQQRQQQPQPHPLYTSPPVSYEASQAAHQQPHSAHLNMQDQAVYRAHYDTSQAQLPTHAPIMHSRPQALDRDTHQSSDSKPTHHDRDDSHPQKPTMVHIGPDMNPLSPTSPIRPNDPYNQITTTMKSLPPASNHNHNPAPLDYPPPTPFTPSTFGSHRGGTWHHTLGSCAEPATCLSSLFCPCIVYGRTQYRLGLKSSQKDPTNMLGYSAINGSCIAWSVLCGFNMLLTAVQHRRVRKAYEMDEMAGSAGSDCVKSACCCCCVIAQDEKEVRLREENGRKGADGMGDRAGYQSPVGMTFGVPPR